MKVTENWREQNFSVRTRFICFFTDDSKGINKYIVVEKPSMRISASIIQFVMYISAINSIVKRLETLTSKLYRQYSGKFTAVFWIIKYYGFNVAHITGTDSCSIQGVYHL